MKTYDNTSVRRQDRLLDESRATELLQDSEYGFLALGGVGGYGIPMNYALCGDRIYFHCAPDGEKMERIDADAVASFCVVGRTEPQGAKLTTLYESVMAFGEIRVLSDPQEKMMALMALVDKYAPEFKEKSRNYTSQSFGRTAALCLEITRITGKCKAAAGALPGSHKEA